MTEPERIDFLIRNLEGNNAAAFARKTGITTPTLSRIRSGELRLKSKVSLITEAYPMIDRNWLETGIGYPGDLSIALVRERMVTLLAEKDGIIATLTKEIELQQKVIERLTK